MSKKITILNTIESPWWKTFRAASRNRVEQVLNITTYYIKANNLKNTELSLVLCDNELVQNLNKEYRGKNKPTNVLSFPYLKYSKEERFENELLGEIFISHEMLRSEAQEQGKKLEDHFKHLLVHSILHIFGYDHLNDKDAEEMETLEIAILDELGIKNPYIIDEMVS